ncbi:hypothetical protein Tco_0506298 [Tanacetum coccineum]
MLRSSLISPTLTVDSKNLLDRVSSSKRRSFVKLFVKLFVGIFWKAKQSYAFSVSLLLTPLCCDDIHDVTPRVSTLAGCDRMMIYWEQVEYDVSDDDDSALKSTAGSVPKDYELGDTGVDGSVDVMLGCVDGKVPFIITLRVYIGIPVDIVGAILNARVDVRTYLLGCAIDGSEANGIIRNPKLELESSHFTFDLVPLSYESVDVVVGENWLLRHKAEMVCHEKVVKMPCVPKELVGFTPRRRIGFRMELVQGATPICEGSCRLTSLERQEVWNDCRSCKVRVGSNGNLLWEASVLLGRKKGGVHGDDVAKTVFRMRNGHVEVYGYAFWVNQCTSGFHGVNEPGGVRVAREDDRGVTEGREDVREVFQQRGSGAKRKLSRCGRNQMGNEPILALPEGADDFVVYYDARSKDLEACLEKGEGDCLYVATTEEAYTTKYSIHPGADTMLCGFRLTNRWLSMKKDIASCGSKYLAYSEVEVEYQGSSGLLLQPELPE